MQDGETTPLSRPPWAWLGLLALTHFLMMADRNLPVLVLPVLQRQFALRAGLVLIESGIPSLGGS